MYYVLNYISSAPGRRKSVEQIVENFFGADNAPEVFAPTFVELVRRDKDVKPVERPLLFHYIFIKASEEDAYRLCTALNGFSFVIDHTGHRRHLMVDDSTVEAFRIIARLHGNRLPCYAVDSITLEEGDRVEIVDGPFAGLIGTYVSRKGGKQGNILISVTQKLAAVVYDIKADYVRVLEFARDSKRAYDQIDAFVPRLLKAIEMHRQGKPLTPKIASPLALFCRRFEVTKLSNPKLDAKLQGLLSAAATLIGDTPLARSAMERYLRLRHEITNPWTQLLVDLSLAEVTGNVTACRQLVARLRSLASESASLSVLHREILALWSPQQAEGAL